MTRARESRLTGLETAAKGRVSTAVQERLKLCAIARVCAAVRAGLLQSGIDADGAEALCRSEAASAEFAGSGSEAGLPGDGDGFDTAGGDNLAGLFTAKIGELARRYEDGSTPDFARASLAELFSWCLAQPAPPC